MILCIMQPYFFPYIGYFQLIEYSDHWVVFDTAQYIRHGWVNRNRILHPHEGWQYITVPLNKHRRETEIQDIQISDSSNWKARILGQLFHYKRKAPFFSNIYSLVQDCLDFPETSLSMFNVNAMAKVCAYLGIPFKYEFFSEMEIDLAEIAGPGDWALRITQALGAKEYVNPPGGAHLFDRTQFEALGIQLTLLDPPRFDYSTSADSVIPNLSIIDVLMWNHRDTVRRYLHQRGHDPDSN